VSIPGPDRRSAYEHLAVLVELDLDAGDRGPNRSESHVIRRHERRDRGELRHAPHLAHRDPDGGEELHYFERRRRGADDVPLAAFEPELRADLREHALLGARARLAELIAHRF